MGADDSLNSSDLIGFNNAVTQSDPYGIAGQALGSWQPNTATWSPGTTMATAFGKSFLSGLLGNYARQNAADQTNSLIGVLPQLNADPLSVTAPPGINPDAFAAFKGTAILKNYIQKAADEDTNKAQIRDLLKSVMGPMIVNDPSRIGDAIKVATADDPAAAFAALPQADPNAESPRMKLLLDANHITDPTTRAGIKTPEELHNLQIYGPDAQKARIDAAAAKAAATKAAADTRAAARQLGLFQTYKQNSGVDTLLNVKNSLDRLEKIDTGPGDLALKEVFARSIIPGQALQAELLSQINSSSSPGDKLAGVFSNWLYGNGQLGPEQRQKIIDVTRALADEKLNNFQKYTTTDLLPRLKANNIDPERVFPEASRNNYFSGLQPQDPTKPIPTGQQTKTGKQIYILNGVKGTID